MKNINTTPETKRIAPMPMTPTMALVEASLFAAIGNGAQLSASGFTVIFSPDNRLHGRADLSGSLTYAWKQMHHAGIPTTDQNARHAPYF
jgi:hypothetical protein